MSPGTIVIINDFLGVVTSINGNTARVRNEDDVEKEFDISLLETVINPHAQAHLMNKELSSILVQCKESR